MKQRNWCADITEAVNDFGFSPQVDLKEGIHRTVQAYKASKKD
jgi:nucleoside-diphosphate-sugar epimerase